MNPSCHVYDIRVTYMTCASKKSGILFFLADPVSDERACVPRGEIIYADGELHILSEDFVHRRIKFIAVASFQKSTPALRFRRVKFRMRPSGPSELPRVLY